MPSAAASTSSTSPTGSAAQVGFLPALRATTTVRARTSSTIDTDDFDGDLLAVNNEYWPRTHRPARSAASTSTTSATRAAETARPGLRRLRGRGLARGRHSPAANSSHSTFVWEDETDRAYLVAEDNTEFHDVDIFEITDPANPRPVAEHDLVELFPPGVDRRRLGQRRRDLPPRHDRQGDRRAAIMMASYWDAGYVKLDVTTRRTRSTSPTARTTARTRCSASTGPRATDTSPSSRTTTGTSWRPTRTSRRTGPAA